MTDSPRQAHTAEGGAHGAWGWDGATGYRCRCGRMLVAESWRDAAPHWRAHLALLAVTALANELVAFDCCTDDVPSSVDVPDDYELGVNHAGARLHAVLARVSPPAPTDSEATS